MQDQIKAAVVIPVYKERMSASEKMSLKQCLRVLSLYPVLLTGPASLNTAAYEKVYKEEEASFRFISFDDNRFEGVEAYNRLLLSREFYERFSSYDYILIYQLDAWVFRDELLEWCEDDFDYIGAPWMTLKGKLDEENSGNGGFSLRKVQAFIDLHGHQGRLLTWKGLCCYHRYRGPLHKWPLVIKGMFGKGNTLSHFTKEQVANEDLFYVTLKYKKGAKFHIPPSRIAKFFSFEEKPSLLYEQTGKQLPFGCHAWQKWEYESFWKQFIGTVDDEEKE